MAGFRLKGNLDGSAYTPSLLYGIGKVSVVFTVGDVVRINTSGYIDLSTANEQVVGIVAGVVDANGLPVDPDSGTTNTWTMGSDNDTAAKLQVSYVPAFGHYSWSVDTDTTITVADVGQYFNVSSTSDSLVTSGQSYTIGTLMFQCIGTDPDGDADASKALVRCVGSQMGQTTIATGAA